MVEGNSLATAFGGVPQQAGKTSKKSMYQVYILESGIQTRYYIGHSHNLAERLMNHNSGKVRSTKAYRPWKIVYSELCESKQEAYKREFQIKSYKGGEAFKKLIA